MPLVDTNITDKIEQLDAACAKYLACAIFSKASYLGVSDLSFKPEGQKKLDEFMEIWTSYNFVSPVVMEIIGDILLETPGIQNNNYTLSGKTTPCVKVSSSDPRIDELIYGLTPQIELNKNVFYYFVIIQSCISVILNQCEQLYLDRLSDAFPNKSMTDFTNKPIKNFL